MRQRIDSSDETVRSSSLSSLNAPWADLRPAKKRNDQREMIWLCCKKDAAHIWCNWDNVRYVQVLPSDSETELRRNFTENSLFSKIDHAIMFFKFRSWNPEGDEGWFLMNNNSNERQRTILFRGGEIIDRAWWVLRSSDWPIVARHDVTADQSARAGTIDSSGYKLRVVGIARPIVAGRRSYVV